MVRRQYQQGVTAVGWLVIIAIVGFFFLLTIRLFPMYYDAFVVQKALDDVAQDRNVSPRNRREVVESLRKQLTVIEGMDAVDPSSVEIRKSGDGFKYVLEYEQREPFLANLSFVGEFRKTAETSQ